MIGIPVPPSRDTERPSRLWRRLVCFFACPGVRSAVENDIDEIFEAIRDERGSDEARRWLRRQALRSIPHFLAEGLFWRRAMWSNILKLGWRNIRKNRSTASINIFGLAIGTAFCILAFLFIRQERSFDSFHDKADRIFLLYHQKPFDGRKAFGTTPPALAPAIDGRIAGIERVVRLAGLGWSSGVPVRESGRVVNLSGVRADSGFFDVFTFPVVAGHPAEALTDPRAIVLRREAARLLFPDVNPVGRVLAVLRDETFVDYTVAGVVDVPRNSSLRFDFVVSLAPDAAQIAKQGWGANNLNTFVLGRPGVSAVRLEADFLRFFERLFAASIVAGEAAFGDHSHPIRALPLRDLYMRSPVVVWLAVQSQQAYSAVLGGIALAVLLIACVNFTNLSLALSSARAKEVGIRKVVGASRGSLLRQFLSESAVTSFLAFGGAVALAALALPAFNALVRTPLALDLAKSWLWLFLMSLGIGFLAGWYPALVLSGFQPAEILRKSLKWMGPRGLSRALVFVQFVVSIALIIISLMMARQMRFMRGRDLGFKAEQVIVVDTGAAMPDPMRTRLVEAFRRGVDHPSLLSVSAVNQYFGSGELYGSSFKVDGEWDRFVTYVVDDDFARTLGVRVVQGRDFSPEFPADQGTSVLVNRTMARLLGYPEPLGRRIDWDGPWTIVGVLEDMHLESFHSEIEPAAFFLRRGNGPLRYILVRVRPENIRQTVGSLERIWTIHGSGFPFVYRFLDDDVDRVFREDGRWAGFARTASLFVVFIACLGAFGLMSLAAVQRTKEVGIRKILGASASAVTVALCREFAVSVGWASLVAWPVAYVFLSRWLRGFAYRSVLRADVFVLGTVLTLAVSVAVVGVRAALAARADPVQALRYE
jgi:putative ABC transport system permease protein